MANPGDPVDGVTQQWPDDRQAVVAGHLALTRLREDQLSPFTVTAAPDEVPAIGELSLDPPMIFVWGSPSGLLIEGCGWCVGGCG